MKFTYVLPILLILVLLPGQAQAQLNDPATATLLNGGSAVDADELDSSRFQIQPVAPRKPKVIHNTPPVPASLVATPTKGQAPAPKPTSTPTPVPTPSPTATPPAEATKPSIVEQVRVLVLGNDGDIEDFQKQSHRDDRRKNFIEISLAPSYFYDSSTSNYSFRRFTAQGPAADVNANIWFSPFFSLHAGYFTSLDAAVMTNAGRDAATADFQDLNFGMRFRKMFGTNRRATSLSWGLDYFVDSMSIPSDAVGIVGTTTSGLSLSLEADMPMGLNYAHLLGIEFRPRLVQSEDSSAAVRSGGSTDTNAVGAWIGGQWIFDRQDQLFWKLQERVEQTSYTGTATTVDPATGLTPNGVSVTNSMTVFSIGYKWGN